MEGEADEICCAKHFLECLDRIRGFPCAWVKMFYVLQALLKVGSAYANKAITATSTWRG